jgi:hypothetical protein
MANGGGDGMALMEWLWGQGQCMGVGSDRDYSRE